MIFPPGLEASPIALKIEGALAVFMIRTASILGRFESG